MKRLLVYIFAALMSVSFFAGCQKMEEGAFDGGFDKESIVPYCAVEKNSFTELSIGNKDTRALINQNSTPESILCNFLRVDEISSGEFDGASYTVDWLSDRSYISDGSISTIADNAGLRTVALSPAQPYNSTGSYKSRMVGWYPRTCDIPQSDKNNKVQTAITQGNAFSDKIIDWVFNGNNYASVKFTGLDGSKDIMVSNVRDGSSNNPFSSTNPFNFKHYLSAVKLFAKAENSSQDIGIWGEIISVSIIAQPTTCIVALPTAEGLHTDSTKVYWADYSDFPIVTTPIFGSDKTAENNVNAEEFPIKLEGSGTEKYLGYSLIQPNSELKLLIKTSSGDYGISIDPKDNAFKDAFAVGHIYNLHLNFNTDGTIMVFIENEGNEIFYDLTSGKYYNFDDETPGSEGASGIEYHYANCYIIDSTPKTLTVGNVTKPYDGYCFDATVVGNGTAGIISNGAQSLYPTSADIAPVSVDVLWESSPRLIHQIDLIYGYVRFKVAKEGSNFKEGNAIIAVYDENRNIIWSWHIWITDTPNEISYTEGSTTISVLDRNLGATAAKWTGAGDALDTYGLYYQWGRKDPSMGPPTWNYSPINMTTAPYYDYSSDVYNSAEVVRVAQPTLKNAVENPMYLILPTSFTQVYYFNWLYEKMDFLWGYAASTDNVHKTIYDPCPYGYRVPAGEIADLFAYARILDMAASQSQKPFIYSDQGQRVKFPVATKKPMNDMTATPVADDEGIYFPYTGYKGVDRGLNSLVASWKYVGQKADYQSAVVSNRAEDADYYMHRSRIYLSKESAWSELNVGNYSGHQIEDFTNRRTAAPVRCVKDVERNIRLLAYLTPDRTTIKAPTQENPSVVNFDIYAESFGSNLSSVTLSVGYHKKVHVNGSDVEGPHKEYVIKSDWGTLSKVLTHKGYQFDFSNLREVDASGNATQEIVNLNETTGTFRFVLTVKNADNINRISSTTITLASNQVGFEEWQQMEKAGNNVVFIGEPVLRRFRIYGHSQPTAVEMIINNDIENPVDITANLAQQTGSSEYTYDYICSTAGLSFMSENENSTAYFIITFADGQTLTTESRTFKVRGIDLVLWTDPDSFESGSYYVIQNVETRGYIYDNGPYMSTSETCTYANFFNISEPYNDNTFRFCNVVSSNYVGQQPQQGNTANLPITTTVSYYSTCFGVDYNSGDQYHTIFNNPYYWNQTNASSNINAIGSNSNSNNKKWKIYKATQKAAPSGN